MTTSKSPRRVLQVAFDAAREAVPAYSHVNSPKTFTQPQLLACLVLKEFLRLDYRGFAEHLASTRSRVGMAENKRFPSRKGTKRVLLALCGLSNPLFSRASRA